MIPGVGDYEFWPVSGPSDPRWEEPLFDTLECEHCGREYDDLTQEQLDSMEAGKACPSIFCTYPGDEE